MHLERPRRHWLTSMWRAIRAYHDLPTPLGFFPRFYLGGIVLSRVAPVLRTRGGGHMQIPNRARSTTPVPGPKHYPSARACSRAVRRRRPRLGDCAPAKWRDGCPCGWAWRRRTGRGEGIPGQIVALPPLLGEGPHCRGSTGQTGTYRRWLGCTSTGGGWPCGGEVGASKAPVARGQRQ